ncbi:hypothetical protein T4B_13743 [Trichinella pseudospiralis]|uniref:Uncharacterized protein n=1 Tax=Trichinella pseudospiralis TaxID=6337 RepID=A0A0V1J5W6_TRIPS|nr:hypothetical protein T4A_13668 [Trichinella pseudospiralis]KRZ30362.1 hypothetical protein T4B_13743 [Trichinella pseudospiralis]KRZ41085.1 hypothetical protein T4C_11824 [Trichinella pseudospiralis]
MQIYSNHSDAHHQICLSMALSFWTEKNKKKKKKNIFVNDLLINGSIMAISIETTITELSMS